MQRKRSKQEKRGADSLVVVVLLLLPPVLVQLVDFNGHILLVCQIKSLQKQQQHINKHKVREAYGNQNVSCISSWLQRTGSLVPIPF